MQRPWSAIPNPHFAQFTAIVALVFGLFVYAEIATWTAGLGDMEAAEILQAAGVAAAPVEDILDILEDPQMQARGFFIPVEDQALGVWPHDGFAWRFSGIPGEIRTPAPLLKV